MSETTRENFVICTSRTCGSGATLISEILAEDYGIPMYDRKILQMASDESGINKELFEKADEHLKKGLLYGISKQIYEGLLLTPESRDFTSESNLFAYQAKVLKELAYKESYVVVGRAADYVLKYFPNVLRVFVYAPMEVCVRTEMERLGISRKDAEKRIYTMDKNRAAFYKHNTGGEWKDLQNYDICLNTGEMSYEQCADLIEEYMYIRYKIPIPERKR